VKVEISNNQKTTLHVADRVSGPEAKERQTRRIDMIPKSRGQLMEVNRRKWNNHLAPKTWIHG
jgi:hypothetical protein